jgi:hypothetical protein
MFITSTEAPIDHWVTQLNQGYQRFHQNHPKSAESAHLFDYAARFILRTLAQSNAPYHNVEHTVLVALTGQEMLQGKHRRDQDVTAGDWFHFILSLLCHDIGYVRGVCQLDYVNLGLYATGVGNHQVGLAPTATDASLATYHVDRSKQFVQETFQHYPNIDIAAIQHNIEFTRFPHPLDATPPTPQSYAGLARAADLVGQLSDPNYLDKLPDLFSEFVETGFHKVLGYQQAQDLQADYPRFFRQILPGLQAGLDYLDCTYNGRQILANLCRNVAIAEQKSPAAMPPLNSRHNQTIWKIAA